MDKYSRDDIMTFAIYGSIEHTHSFMEKLPRIAAIGASLSPHQPPPNKI